MKNAVSLLIFLCATTAFAVVDVFKTAVIKDSDPSLVINIADKQFLRIHNFTQDINTGTRGAVIAAAATPTATPTATATPVPTATPATADLIATKTDDASGHVITPNPWNWTITVANSGGTASTFFNGQNILTDNLPNANISYGAVSVNNVMNITNSGAISCGITGSDLTCTASGADVTIGSGGSFEVKFSATPAADGSYANPRTGGGCSVDTNNVVAESNESNNNCSDTVVSGTPTPAPTPTAPPRAVLTAAIADPNSPPEPIKQIVIDGPATVTINPVSGATLVLTYIKTPESTPTPSP